MAVSDLTNTTWVLNSDLTNAMPQSATAEYDINFTSNGTNYIQMTLDGVDYGAPPPFGGPAVLSFRTSNSHVDVYNTDNGWTSQAYRTIEITGGTDATSSGSGFAFLVSWLEENATQQSTITDLTGYTWVGNDTFSVMPNGTSFSYAGGPLYTYYLNFNSNSANFTSIIFADDDYTGTSQPKRGINYDRTYAWCSNSFSTYQTGWQNTAYKTIQITGGADATNASPNFATLLAWLEANGTLTAPVVTAGSISIGSSPLQKCYVGNNEAQKIYIGDKLVYEKQAPSGYSVTVLNYTGMPTPFALYDGQNNTGIYLGRLDWDETQTFTITSGYIYGEWIGTPPPDAFAFYHNNVEIGNPVQVTSNITLSGRESGVI